VVAVLLLLVDLVQVSDVQLAVQPMLWF